MSSSSSVVRKLASFEQRTKTSQMIINLRRLIMSRAGVAIKNRVRYAAPIKPKQRSTPFLCALAHRWSGIVQPNESSQFVYQSSQSCLIRHVVKKTKLTTATNDSFFAAAPIQYEADQITNQPQPDCSVAVEFLNTESCLWSRATVSSGQLACLNNFVLYVYMARIQSDSLSSYRVRLHLVLSSCRYMNSSIS